MCGRVLAVSGRPTCVRTTGLGSLPRALLRVTRVRALSQEHARVCRSACLLPAAYTRTIKHTACPARRDSREAAGEGLGRSTRWTRLITPRFDQLGFLVALPSPLDKQQKGVLRRFIAGVGLHTRVCTRYPATSAAVHCAQQRTRTCSLSVHLHLKRAEANKP
jgi:hypothetical protein